MVYNINKTKTSVLILVIATLLLTWFAFSIYRASKQDDGLEAKKILRLKYDLFCSLVEYEPGKELEFRKSDVNATLAMELMRAGDRYILNLTVNIKGYAFCIENRSRAYTELRKCATFEYDVNTRSFYWQGKDVGILLPMFQPLGDRIILFNAEFIPLGTEPKISHYPLSSQIWAPKRFTSRVDLKEGKVYVPELNRTWWLSEAEVRPPIWDVLKALSKIAGSDTLEIMHYTNDTLISFPSAYIERNTGIIIHMRMPGPFRMSKNATIIVNDVPVSTVPMALLPYSLGLRDSFITLNLIDVEYSFPNSG